MRHRLGPGVVPLTLAVALVACSAPAGETPAATDSTAVPSSTAIASSPSARSAPSAPATPWRDASETRDAFNTQSQAFVTPAELLEALSEFVEERTGARDVSSETTRSERDRAEGIVVAGNVPDDSIFGEEYRVEMRRSGTGWVVESLEVRTLCRRGLSGDLCV